MYKKRQWGVMFSMISFKVFYTWPDALSGCCPPAVAGSDVTSGFMAGKRRTSLISANQSSTWRLEMVYDSKVGRRHALVESVKNMTRRSIPMPHPPVGASPCSRLKRHLSSVEHTYYINKRRTHQWKSRRLLELHHHLAIFALPSKELKKSEQYKTTKRN